jgi:glycosidase
MLARRMDDIPFSRSSRMTMHALCLTLATLLAMTLPSSGEAGIRQSLDGEWLFKVDLLKAGIAAGWFREGADLTRWQKVQTPAFWESYPGMAAYDGWGWFARKFSVPALPGPMSLHFAGVDDEALVWVNGVEVGSHSGYSDPFAVNLEGALHRGENTVVVLVKDFGGGGGIYKPITLIETSALDTLLRSAYSLKPAVRSAEWVRDAVLYSVYLRSFSTEGTFAGLEKRLPELKKLGATVLWLMPIHPIGSKHRKGTLGSPYAVQDYYGINPEFGSMADFKHLLAAAHKQSFRLIIDLVANHTSWDSKLITTHPEWFTKDSTGAIVPPNADWTDVADLDYSKAGLRKYMTDMMVWWVKDVGIDGFRCDVAELVPTDFWEEARTALNAVKPVMMLSEGSLPEHHLKAFDLTYSWNIYDALDPLIQRKRPVVLIDQILKNEQLQFPAGSLRMRFTTNHDKNAWDSPAVLRYGPDGLKLSTVLVNTIPGVPMIYTGEEVSNDKKLSLFEKVTVDWTRPREVGKLYQRLFRLRREHPCLVRGEMIRVTTNIDDAVYAFWRVAGDDRVLVVLNFGAESKRVALVSGVGAGEYREAFSGAVVDLSGAAEATLGPFGYAVFVKY